MIKNKIWITVGLIALIVLTGALKEVWGGFLFFSLSFLTALCLYWAFVFIYKYLEDYKWHFDEDFAYYKAQTINSTSLTEKDFDMARDVYVQKYKKSLVRDKMIDIFKIIFCLSLAITCIGAMCSGVVA
ncbi:MAG: hypothetical protein IJY90_01470 [Clostridia bacterium]|nr:hypothetical protein [Clostridia bacterium]